MCVWECKVKIVATLEANHSNLKVRRTTMLLTLHDLTWLAAAAEKLISELGKVSLGEHFRSCGSIKKRSQSIVQSILWMPNLLENLNPLWWPAQFERKRYLCAARHPIKMDFFYVDDRPSQSNMLTRTHSHTRSKILFFFFFKLTSEPLCPT